MKRLLLRTAAFTRDLNSWLKIHPSSHDRACSAGHDLRIVFQMTEHQGDEAIVLLALGTHDDVY